MTTSYGFSSHRSTASGHTPAPSPDAAEVPSLSSIATQPRGLPDSRSVWRSNFVFLAKLAVAAGLVSWLLASGRLDLRVLASIPISGELGILIALTFGSMALPALRWWWLLRVQQLREPLGRVFSLTWAGYFAALVLPGAASGDIAKSYLILRRQPKARACALSTILADRFIGIHSLLCLGGLSIFWLARRGEMTPSVRTIAGGTLALLLGVTLAAGLLLFAPSRKLLLRVLPESWRVAWDESFALYGARKGAFFGCFVLSLASNIMAIGCFTVAGSLLGDNVGLDVIFLAGPLIILANCLPFSPGGIGVAETASSELFASFGVRTGAEMMVILRVCIAVVALPGVVMAMGTKRHLEKRHVSPSTLLDTDEKS